MRITPRKDETERVVALLESDEFDSADKMAKAIIKEVADILSMRDYYAITHRWGDNKGINWGPYGSESEAAKVAEKLQLGGKWGLVKVYSSGMLAARMDGKLGWKGLCQSCGHVAEDHLMVASSRGRCAREDCKQCETWTK